MCSWIRLKEIRLIFGNFLKTLNSPDTLLEGDTDEALVVLAVVEPVLGRVAGVHDRRAPVAADVAALLQEVAPALGQCHVFLGTLVRVLPLKIIFKIFFFNFYER